MRILLFIFFTLITVGTFAQKVDTAVTGATGVSKMRSDIDRVAQKLSAKTPPRIDTLKDLQQRKFDSLSRVSKHLLDSLDGVGNNGVIQRAHDKVLSIVNRPADSINGTMSMLQKKVKNVQDSTNAAAKKFVSKIENGATQGIKSRSDTLQQKINAVGNKLSGTEKKIQGKADSLERKATATATAAEKKVESKINSVTGENGSIPGADKLQSGSPVPGVNLPDTKLPSAGTDLNVDKAIKTDLPGTNDLSLQKDIPAIKDKVPDLKVPKMDQLKSGELNKVNDVSSQLKKADGQLGEAEKYEGELKKVKSGEESKKLEGDAQKQVENMEPVKGLTNQISKSKEIQEKQAELIKQYTDKKLIQEEIDRKAKSVANDFMGEHAAQLQQGQSQLAKTKRPFGNIKSVKDIFRRRSDELEGKKFYQRLVPGITFQSYHASIPSLMFGFQTGYRISPKLIGGVGILYTAGFSDKYQYYVKSQGLYGGRAYFDFSIAKSFFAHAEFEAVKVSPVVLTSLQQNEVAQNNVYGSYFGIGKRFKIARNLKGNILGLYRVDYNHDLAVNRVSLRVGVDYVFRKAKLKLK